MENTSYISLSKQMTLQQQMNLIANNIANASTSGFKSQHMVQTEEKMGEMGEKFPSRMVMDYGMFTNLEQGPIQRTSNTYDFALQGQGYFAVENERTGGEAYTRAGSFALNSNNEIVTPSGNKVLGVSNAPIVIPDNATEIVIDKKGNIYVDGNDIDSFKLMEFDNDQTLRELGQGIYIAEVEGNPAKNTEVYQGMVEGSNVQAVVQMTEMIEISRMYQMNQTIIKNEHERMRGAIQKLGRLSG